MENLCVKTVFKIMGVINYVDDFLSTQYHKCPMR